MWTAAVRGPLLRAPARRAPSRRWIVWFSSAMRRSCSATRAATAASTSASGALRGTGRWRGSEGISGPRAPGRCSSDVAGDEAATTSEIARWLRDVAGGKSVRVK
ncbi:unnamed protein product [Closterium sp. NIES-54]